jgi:hypothetical protein
MEREITRNDFGQIVSYEITSSNLEYGKVFLEPFVEKFDEDSYNDEYPLPQKDEFELPFNQVFVSFDVTQVSFPALEFKYLSTGSGGPPTPPGGWSPPPPQTPPSGSFPLYGTLLSGRWAGYGQAGVVNECNDLRSNTNRNVVGYANKPVNQLVVGDIIYEAPPNSISGSSPIYLPPNMYHVYASGSTPTFNESIKVITFDLSQIGRISNLGNCPP